MKPWEFVALAYGIVWTVILVYWYQLKRRYNRAATELKELEGTEASASHAKK